MSVDYYLVFFVLIIITFICIILSVFITYARIKILDEDICIKHSQIMTKLSENLVRTALNTKMLEQLQCHIEANLKTPLDEKKNFKKRMN